MLSKTKEVIMKLLTSGSNCNEDYEDWDDLNYHFDFPFKDNFLKV